ncbi:hypothetical protein FC83_GL001021 [Agrilactobacillus composti DSM 18527 = JCM 14202]|uniref:Uncharacterized protein n=2 Tax=Agrilactobacillus TaxID=2767875 RepID=A0A0R1XW37_9LACO|nr:hypothetical protein FC83_GL001021 [Agrilactobacillus composti DSM 18527 = JCM 14202]
MEVAQMAMLGQELLIVAVLLGIPTILLLQYILGYKQVSSRTAKVVPVIYGLLLTFFTLANLPWTTNHWLFLGSQWLVSYFFYFIYEFAKGKSIQKIGDLSKN